MSRKGEPPIRSFFARIYYRLINRLSKVEMIDGVRDFRVMSRKMVDAVIGMPEYNRYSKGIFSFVGFKTKWVEFEHVDRVAGETHWSFWKLFLYGIEAICAFSTVPLVLSAVLGLLFCFIAFVMIIVIIVKTLAFGDPVGGWPSLICAVLMMGGLQMMALGVMELVPVILMVVTEVARAVSMPFWRSRQAPRRAGHLACSKFLIVAGPKGIQRPTEKPFCRAVARPPAPHAHEPMTKDPAPCCETGVERGEAPLRGCRGRAPRPGFRRAAPFGGGVEGRTPNRAPGAAPLVSDAACFPACGGASAERRS